MKSPHERRPGTRVWWRLVLAGGARREGARLAGGGRRRRIGLLVRLARPYGLRTAAAVATLLAHRRRPCPLLSRQARRRRGDLAGESPTGSRRSSCSSSQGIGALVLSSAQTYLTGWVGERVLADPRERLFGRTCSGSRYYERNRTGAIVSRITNDVEALDQLVTDGLTSLVQNTLLLFGTAVVLFLLDWRLALATLLVIPLMVLVTAWFRGPPEPRLPPVCASGSGLATATLVRATSRACASSSRSLREPVNQTSFRGISDCHCEANYETVVLNGLYFPAVDFSPSVATAIVLGYGGWLVLEGDLTTGTLLAFTLYLSNFFDPVQQLSQLYNTFLSAIAALDRIVDLLDEEPDVIDAPDAGELDPIRGRAHFDAVRFGYGEGPEVLHGVELDVAAGTTVALVGHTGAGKSTIAKLLARFYDPRQGLARSTVATCAR